MGRVCYYLSGDMVVDMRKGILLIVLLLVVLLAPAYALSFRQVSYFPSGLVWSTGYIKGTDVNNDGYEDLLFAYTRSSQWGTVFWGYRPYNRYVLEDSIQWPLFWEVGYLDDDSLIDICTQYFVPPPADSHYIRVYEQVGRDSFPKSVVWSWEYEYWGHGTQNMYFVDLDRDGLKEILTGDASIVYVFENRGDNQYVKVFSDTSKPGYCAAVFAFGDYDGDGQMEFVRGSIIQNPAVYLYECTGDDQYQMTWTDSLNTANMTDLISGPDLDNDGKLEFIFGSNHLASGGFTGALWIYESTGNNQYDISFTDSITGLSDRGVYATHSDCGDVDRDGRPELVWAIDRDWMVYKSPGNNQFQRVFSAYGDNGHNSTNIHIHDLNGNGYPEIIESGGNETHIWEVEACQVVYPNGGETLYCDTSYAIRWRNIAPFVADSFSLFFSADSSRTYSLIARGIPGSDSSFVWTVPDTLSDTCFIMLWAYQNATGWDFSDGPFRIRRPDGVEVTTPYTLHPTPLPLSVAPNPFVSYASVPGHERESFALYDVSGRKVGVFKGVRIGVGLSAGVYFLKPEAQDAKPLRIVKLR